MIILCYCPIRYFASEGVPGKINILFLSKAHKDIFKQWRHVMLDSQIYSKYKISYLKHDTRECPKLEYVARDSNAQLFGTYKPRLCN